MFKKSLIAIAALGAFAGSAMAADVTLYGKVDAGLNYHSQKADGADREDGFSMKSGQNSGSRFGLKGTEDLGNGMKVGFLLENGFDVDAGTFTQADRLFGREANLYLQGDFGTLSMGRLGALSSGLGSYSFVYGYTPFGTGWGSYAAGKSQFGLATRDRFDNTVTYVTPDFAGVKVYAQYSLQTSGAENDQSTKNGRYAALGAKWDMGAFSTGIVVDSMLKASTADNTEDSLGVSWGASYDLGVTKLMAMAQYGSNEDKLAGFSGADIEGADKFVQNEGLKGYALTLGAVTPLAAGTLFTSVHYADGKTESAVQYQTNTGTADDPKWSDTKSLDGDVTRWGFAVGYQYPLSKRTYLYGFAGYNEGEFDGKKDADDAKYKVKDTEVGFGLVHSF